MLSSLLEANVAHEDFELARSVKWELMQLRSRGTTPTADDVMLIARKAGLAEFLQNTPARPRLISSEPMRGWRYWRIRSQEMPKRSGKTGTTRLVDTSLLWARAL